jgi:glycosyltransferase involved in cell wall biosynthesis
MIWQFLLPHIKHLQNAGNVVECACDRTGFWFDDLRDTHGLTMHEVNFARSPYKILQNRRAFKKLKAVVKNGGFDLIHTHQPVGGVMGRRVGAACGIPVIYTAHGFHFYKGAPKKMLLYKMVEKKYSKKTDALVTMNNEDFGNAKKMKAKRVYKINGIGYDPTKNKAFEFDKEALRGEIGVAETDFVLVNIGECIKRKNQRILIEAMRTITDEKVKLLICGGGKLLDEYRQLVESLGLCERVKCLGYRKDVRNILKIADVFVSSSVQEGLPMGMMEAMFEGMPVITSNIRGSSDLIQHNENGLLVGVHDLGGYVDAIKTLAVDKKMCAKMGAENQDRVKQYYIEEVLKQMEEIYDDVFP